MTRHLSQLKRLATAVCFVLAFLTFSEPGCAQSVRDISIIIGRWSVEEHHPNGWWEKGDRTCRVIMDSTYIECETKATSSTGNSRTYRFLINYNTQAKRFEMLGIYSNWPLKQHDSFTVDSSGKTWSLQNIPLNDDSVERRATITFSDTDNYTWSGRNVNHQKKTTTEFTEVGRRICP